MQTSVPVRLQAQAERSLHIINRNGLRNTSAASAFSPCLPCVWQLHAAVGWHQYQHQYQTSRATRASSSRQLHACASVAADAQLALKADTLSTHSADAAAGSDGSRKTRQKHQSQTNSNDQQRNKESHLTQLESLRLLEWPEVCQQVRLFCPHSSSTPDPLPSRIEQACPLRSLRSITLNLYVSTWLAVCFPLESPQLTVCANTAMTLQFWRNIASQHAANTSHLHEPWLKRSNVHTSNHHAGPSYSPAGTPAAKTAFL